MKGEIADDSDDDKAPDSHDDFLQQLPVSSSIFADPGKLGDEWHICRDFLDQLANELEEWLSIPNHTAADIESLIWFDVGMNQSAGPDACISAWRRARAFLNLNATPEFRKSLEDAVSGLAKEACKVLQRLEKLPPDGDDPQWRDNVITIFEMQVVERCLGNLQAMSAQLRCSGRVTPIPGRDDWIKVTDASRLSKVNKGIISRAAKNGEITTNGKQKLELRLELVSFARWELRRSPIADSHIPPAEVEKRAREMREKRGIVADN